MFIPLEAVQEAPTRAYDPAPSQFYGRRDPALDSFGRRINYLRVSLTDRCNFRCLYCMPEHGAHFAPRDELLTDDELLQVIEAAAMVGFQKIRLTGGEPSLRRNIVEIVRRIAATPGITEISMTTNALRLNDLAQPLREAGLTRVNISIDSLNPTKFKQMTRGGDFARVWSGIEAAERVGFKPMKFNAVVVRGLNDDEVVDIARLTVDRPWQFRFIEMMPLAGVGELAEQSVVPTREIIARLEQAYGELEFIGWFGSDPARTYRIPGAQGTLGFISSITEPFCSTCNRMRLTADGKLHLCLLRDNELDLRQALRNGAMAEDLAALVRQAVWLKPWGHGLPEGIKPTLRGMSELGG
jgi:cyclic pyranopterin phosphate synthase